LISGTSVKSENKIKIELLDPRTIRTNPTLERSVEEEREKEKEMNNDGLVGLSSLIVVIILVFAVAAAVLYLWPVFVAYWLYTVVKKKKDS
jgi:uncharacterized membrane protein